MSNTLKFQSEDLQKAYENSNPTLENIQNRQNSISQDIKNLEKYLLHLKIPEDFELCLENFECDDPDLFWGENIYSCNSAPCKVIREILKWDCKSNRLIYIRFEADGDYNPLYLDHQLKPYCHEEFVQVMVRPLIETKFEIRESMSNYLVSFLESLSCRYGGNNQTE